jgi:hypothetical protein
MARWRQDKVTGKLIPIDETAVRRDAGVAIHGPIEPFVSPIDGSVISDRRQLAEHNKRHGVVQAQEFNPEFLERKRAERESLYKGEHTKAEKLARKQEIYEAITRAERANQ